MDDAYLEMEISSIVELLINEFDAAKSMGCTNVKNIIISIKEDFNAYGFNSYDHLFFLSRLHFVTLDKLIPTYLSATILKTLNSVDADPDARLQFIHIHAMPKLAEMKGSAVGP